MAVAMLYPEAARVKRKGSGSSKIEDLASGMVSMAYPEPEKGGRGKTGKVSKLFGEFAGELLRQARLVLRVTPTVAQSVIAGEKPLAVAYDEAKGAHDELVSRAHRAQADALEIEALAKRRLADEYDAAQERGEVASGRPKKSSETEDFQPTASDLGLTHKEIHEARQIRDAEGADPGAHPGGAPRRRAAQGTGEATWRARQGFKPASGERAGVG